MYRLLIIGAGGHGCSVAEAAELSDKFQIIGFIDDRYPDIDAGSSYPVLGRVDSISSMVSSFDTVIVAIGDNYTRKRLQTQVREAGLLLSTVVHPFAFVSPRASVGDGCAIMAGAVIGAGASLGDGVIVNAGSIVDHHCHVGSFAHLGIRCAMAGATVIGPCVLMVPGSILGHGERMDT